MKNVWKNIIDGEQGEIEAYIYTHPGTSYVQLTVCPDFPSIFPNIFTPPEWETIKYLWAKMKLTTATQTGFSFWGRNFCSLLDQLPLNVALLI